LNATIELSDKDNLEIGKVYTITKEPFNSQVSANINALRAEHTVKGSDAITITYEDNIIERADDILNNLIYQYNVDARMYKNASVNNTINFLDERLSILSKELSDIESSFKDYKESNVVVNPESESELTLQTGSEYQKKLSDIIIQQQVLNLILDQINQPIDSTGGFIPENVGIADIGINASIMQYNQLISERNRLLASSSPDNPRVILISSQIQDLKAGISLSLSNFKNTLDIRSQELLDLVEKEKRKISSFPSLQLDLAKISRQQQIIEPLYLLLQQKKEEAQILLYAAKDNARVIEDSYGSLVPIKPKKILYVY
jgi:tyrosine-protein kinase Etk/Wzc